MIYKGFLKNVKKGSLATVTAADIFVVEKPQTRSTDATQPNELIAKGQVEGMIDGSNATGTVLTLSNGGTNYNYTTPSAATTYTLVTGFKTNEFARCFINAPTEPTITGATKILGNDFIPNVMMEMVVESPNGTAVEFYFVER